MPTATRFQAGTVDGEINRILKNEAAKAASAGGGLQSASASLAPVPSLAIHAANRLMYGPAAGDIQRIGTIGYDAFLAEQLNPAGIDDTPCGAKLAALPRATLTESWAQLYDRRNVSWEESYRPFNEVRHATWTRILYSKRQLFERMVEFWHNHFNVYAHDNPTRSLWPKYDAVMRQHALGNFRQMLEAVATNPCMLYYLDNYISTDGGPNENYAREMIELHTLGSMHYQVPGGYIDQDVYEASRCFTGWTYERQSSSPNRGQFKYNGDDHDRFIKVFLGAQIPGDQAPLKDGRDVLDRVAFHPGTARHIAWKLAVRFIGDFPPDSIIASTADVFMANKNAPDQIKKTLQHLLSSDAFKNARMTKFKRPLDWVASAMRALKMDYTTDDTFVWLYDEMGMSMFGWRLPDGAPDHASHWATSNNLLKRWNWAFRIISNWFDHDGLYAPTILPASVNTPRGVALQWIGRLICRPVSDETMTAMCEFVAEGRNWDLPMPDDEIEDKIPFAAALALMSPEFMRR